MSALPSSRPSFSAGLAVRPDREIYVERAVDRSVKAAARAGRSVHVMGSRMAGKSSLAAHLAAALAGPGTVVLRADLGSLTVTDTTCAQLVRALAQVWSARLRAAITPRRGMTPAVDLVEIVRRAVAATGATRVHLILDELDVTATTRRGALGGELLAALAHLRAEAQDDPSLGQAQITVLSVRPLRSIAGADDRGLALVEDRDVHWIDNLPFDDGAKAALASGFPPDLAGEAFSLADRALAFSGGFPQACVWMCAEVARLGWHATADLDERMAAHVDRVRVPETRPAFFTQPSEYLTGYAASVGSGVDPAPRRTTAEALWIYRDLVQDRVIPHVGSDPAHSLLLWSGLARLTDTGGLSLRGRMLARHLNRAWAIETRLAYESTTKVSARRDLPRIAILNTGGTIGMVEREGQVRPAESSHELLAEHEGLGEVANVDFFDTLKPPLDSANVAPPSWTRIAEAIGDLQREGYVGLVVAHGTDTMAFSASATAFALGPELSFPVVFTGAQTTANVLHGDAGQNLIRACKVAASGRALPEVVVAFGDKVLRATRAQKTDDRGFDAFDSPTYPALARITESIDLDRRAIRRIAGPKHVEPRASFDDGFLYIAQVPGLQPRFFDAALTQADELGLHGIIIETLGAGNVPTVPGYSLEDFIYRASTIDIPVVMGCPYPIYMGNPGRYGPSAAALGAGAIPAFNMTMAALVAKFAWVLGQHREDRAGGLTRLEWVQQEMPANYVGELDVEFDVEVPDPSVKKT